jgi:hypothetical protein
MHVVQRLPRQRVVHGRRMYSPLERNVVNGVGLGEVDGLFDIGKMFTRLTTFTPSSFKLSNIAGAIGSLTAFTATGGLSSLAPKLTSAHSALMKDLGYGTIAVAAVAGGAALMAAPAAGATGVGLTTVGSEAAGSSIIGGVTGQTVAASSTGIMSTIGSGISSVGSGLMNVVKALPFVGQMLSHGSGVPTQQTQSDAYAQQYADAQAQAAQQAYAAQVAAQQAALYTPGYNPSIPFVAGQYQGGPLAPADGGSYGDLRSPYTAITDDGKQVQIDPTTGQIVQASMFPDWSWTTWLMVGGVLACGLYVAADDKK